MHGGLVQVLLHEILVLLLYVQGLLKTSITILSGYAGAVEGLEGGAEISGAEVPSHQDKALSREQSSCSN